MPLSHLLAAAARHASPPQQRRQRVQTDALSCLLLSTCAPYKQNQSINRAASTPHLAALSLLFQVRSALVRGRSMGSTAAAAPSCSLPFSNSRRILLFTVAILLLHVLQTWSPEVSGTPRRPFHPAVGLKVVSGATTSIWQAAQQVMPVFACVALLAGMCAGFKIRQQARTTAAFKNSTALYRYLLHVHELLFQFGVSR